MLSRKNTSATRAITAIARRYQPSVWMPKFMTRAVFCPPSSRLPNGRARKLTAKVTKASSVASTGSDLATSVKKMSPK